MLNKRLNNLKIRSKLVFFLVVPILTLLYFSISGIYLKYQEQIHTQNSLDSISLSLSLSDLIHELQKERGLSAGFVGSRGALHGEALVKQRLNTDEKYKQFTLHLNRTNHNQKNLSSPDIFSHFQSMLEQLLIIRPRIDILMSGDFFDVYSEINTMGLNINMHLQTRISDIDLSRHVDAYNTLLWLQERSGQERGLLNGVFSAGQLSANQFKSLSAYSFEQETLINHFFTVASHKQRVLLQEKMQHPVMNEVKALQTAAINKALKNDLLNGLQIVIGYGGLVHNFKNYVIRGQQPYVDKYSDLYARAINIIDQYRNLPGMSQKEIDSLTTIEETFLEYERLLKVTKRLRDEGKNISEIDAVVMVDDKPALTAIEYLHKSVTGLDTDAWWEKASVRIQLIKEVSDFIRTDMLSQAEKISVNTTRSLYVYIILTITSLMLSALLAYLIIQRLVGGILNIAQHMKSMQEQGDFSRAIDVSGTDELSDVARAFNSLIEERKSSGEKLKLAATVFNSTNEAITVTDADKHITMVNPAFTKITGYTQEEVLGKDPGILKSGKHDRSFYKNMWDTLLQEGHWIGEIQNRRKNGEIYPEMLNISAIKNDQGKIMMYIGMFLDITKRKQSEEKQNLLQRQLLQAQKMEALGQLTGGIAHDFNNMLAAILGFTSLADDHVKKQNMDEKLQGYLNQIYKAGNRAKQVVTQLLAFSRSDMETELESVDITGLVNESIRMIRPLLPSTIEIIADNSAGDQTIMSNPVMVHQVLMNLCINARDAIGEHGRIEFRINEFISEDVICRSCHKPLTGEFIEVSVSDTGRGIDYKNIENLFEPFFTTKALGNEKGTGMGLAMVHGIMHKLDGHILVESSMGKGSKFSLLFPLQRDNGLLEPENLDVMENMQSEGNNDTANKTNYHILCVDDEESLVMLMEEILESEGHKVSIFNDSRIALETFNKNPSQYDLIITDQTMPKLTGTEMAKAMLEVKPDLPIILCSGYSDNIDREGAESIGIKAYLEKPVNMKSLFKIINDLKINK